MRTVEQSAATKIYLERFESATGRRECLNTLMILYLVLFITFGELFGSGGDIREVAQLKVLNEGFFLRMRLFGQGKNKAQGTRSRAIDCLEGDWQVSEIAGYTACSCLPRCRAKDEV